MKRNLAVTPPDVPCVPACMHSSGMRSLGFVFRLFLLPILLRSVPLAAQANQAEWNWAEQAGGPAADRASVVATSSFGTVYTAGTFSGTAAFGTTSLTSRGAADIFVSKYAADGNLLWTHQIGGPAAEGITKMTTDGSYNLYIAGVFSGTADFGDMSLTSAGAEDAFLAKYDALGALLWVKQAGGAADDNVVEMSVDISEKVHLAVFSQATPLLDSHIFIYRYESSGELEWLRNAGGVGGTANDVVFDDSGNAYATGSFRNSATFDAVTFTTTSDPGLMLHDVFTVKYDAGGDVQWAQQGKVTDGGFGASVQHAWVDEAGNLYIAGTYDFDLQFGDEQPLEYNAFTNAYLAKYDYAGNLLWAKVVEATEYGYDIVSLSADASGNAYLAYNFRGSLGTELHIKIQKFDAEGNHLFTIEEKSEETNEYEDGLPAKYVFVDKEGRIYVTFSFFGIAYISGTTENYDYTGPFTSDHISNLFTAIYDVEGVPVWVQQVETADIAEATDGVYMAGSFENTATFGTTTLTSSGDTDAFLAKAVFGVMDTPYCIPPMSSGCADDHYIAYFEFASLYYNAVGQGCRNDNSYTNFYPREDKVDQSYYVATVKPGQSYPISLKSESAYGGPSQEQAYGVWIDYNDDKDFDDPGEFVYSSPAVGADFSGTVVIPADAAFGVRRLRVRSRPEGVFTASESCTAGTYGETQDYTIAIGYCAPFPASQSNDGSYIDNFSFHTLVNNNSGFVVPGYTLYEPTGTFTTSVTKGQSYPISVQSGPVAQAFGVWVDYNNDLDFDDEGELVYATPITGEDYEEEGELVSPSVSTEVYNGTVMIPTSATAGSLRMRVRSNSFPFRGGGYGACAEYDSDPSGPDSDSFLYGETEDYTITVEEPEVAPPTLASFTPQHGLPGTAVQLTGTALATTSAVRFNGVEAEFTVISDTQLEAVVPATATTGSITVTTAGGEATSGTDFVVLQPSIFVFAPWWGHAGSNVIIIGQNLSTTKEVRFNGVAASSFTVYNNYLARATVPAGATTGKISLQLNGGAEAVSPWDFQVLWRPSALIASEASADSSTMEAASQTLSEEDLVAYPNPFEDGVTISATLHQKGPVELIIFSELGQKVREIRYGQLGEGRHELKWDGRDSRGVPVAHGFYFYQVVLRNRHLSGKLLKTGGN